MRKATVLVGIFLGLFLFLSLKGAHAALCSVACTPTASCSKFCNDGTLANPVIITCGEYGVCGNPLSPARTSNWMTTSTAIGGSFMDRRPSSPPPAFLAP